MTEPLRSVPIHRALNRPSLYQFWGCDREMVMMAGLMAGVAVWWRKHDCHVKWCPRIQWHPHPVHGHPVCRRHHPESQFKSDGSQHAPNPRHQAVMHKSDVEHGGGLVAEPASAGGAKSPSPRT